MSRSLIAVTSLLALLGLTCARGNQPKGDLDPVAVDTAERSENGYSAAFVLTWQGLRIGDATEELHRRHDGMRLVRHERLIIGRGDTIVRLSTRIVIDTDAQLRAQRVTVRRATGDAISRGAAHRARGDRWRVWFGNEPMRTVPGDAVPAELVPLLVARSPKRSFSGKVLLAGYGFATARLAVRPVDSNMRRVHVALHTDLGRLESHIDLTRDGSVLRVSAGNAVGARRASPDELGQPFVPPEMVISSSLPVAGVAGSADRVVLRVTGATRPPPPDLPGQRVRADAAGWTVTLTRSTLPSHAQVLGPSSRPRQERWQKGAGLRSRRRVNGFADLARRIVEHAGATDRRSELAALVRATEHLLADDMTAAATDPRSALSLGRGDCTSHAALFAALARARGIDTRLVTGYRLEGNSLTRHRWVIAANHGSWIAFDPTYGEAPAAARLLGLAVHTASASDIAMVDELAFSGMRTARVAVR